VLSFWSDIASDTPTAAAAIVADMGPMLALVFGVALAAVVVTIALRAVRG